MTRPENLELDDQLCFALYAASNAIIRTYRPLLRDIGLTYPQYLVMLVLWQHGEGSITGIASRLDLPGHALTPLVRRLQLAGFVSRRRDDDDRRLIHIELTDSGRELEVRAAQVARAVARRTRLCPPALADMRVGLHALVERMSEPETAACG